MRIMKSTTLNIRKHAYASVLVLFGIFGSVSLKAGEVDLLLITDFEQLRNCIDLSPDLGLLEKYRSELISTGDLENKRRFFESIGVMLLKRYGKPTVSIQGCECTPLRCEYSSF